MSRTGWTAAVSCAAMLAANGAAWARKPRPMPDAAAQAGRRVSPEQVFVRKPFSADMLVTSAKRNGTTFHGKMYASEHALRMDLEIQPGQESSTIVRFDKKVIWVLVPAERRYLEMPLTSRAGLMATLRGGEKYELRELGPERIGSYACEKYRVHWADNGRRGSGYVWVASGGDIKGFVVRAEDETTGAMNEYRNILPGEPPASLFDVPPGYQKIEMPGMVSTPGVSHR